MSDGSRPVAWFVKHPAFRLVLLTATFGFIAWALAGQWTEVRSSAVNVRISWSLVAIGTAVMIATYAALVESWRMLLAGWGDHLTYRSAVRIWTISNLGRWVPGKIWSVGALGVLASEEGVPGAAAAGAALLGTALNIGAGFAVLAIFGLQAVESLFPGASTIAVTLASICGVGILALPWLLPPALDKLARLRGLPTVNSHISATTLWMATAINACSWIAYGVAFMLFARAVLPGIAGGPSVFIAVYSASYLAGYLALFSPGGLGVREAVLVTLLVTLGLSGKGDAAVLSVTSRLWITILEIVPGIISLLFLSPAQRAGLRGNAARSSSADKS